MEIHPTGILSVQDGRRRHMGGGEEAGVDINKEVLLRVFGDGVTCLLTDVFYSSEIRHTSDEGKVVQLGTSWTSVSMG